MFHMLPLNLYKLKKNDESENESFNLQRQKIKSQQPKRWSRFSSGYSAFIQVYWLID